MLFCHISVQLILTQLLCRCLRKKLWKLLCVFIDTHCSIQNLITVENQTDKPQTYDHINKLINWVQKYDKSILFFYYRGFAGCGMHLYAHNFAPPPAFLFVWNSIEKNNKLQKTLELLIYFMKRFKISECANILVTLMHASLHVWDKMDSRLHWFIIRSHCYKKITRGCYLHKWK